MGTKDNSNDAAHFKEIYEHLNVDYPLAVYFVRPEEYFLNNIPWHWHEEIEIDIVREGNAIYTVGEQSLMVPYNHAILIKGNTGHSIKSVQGQNCTIMSVILSPKLLFSDSSSMRSAYESPFIYNEKVILISPSDRIGKTLISYLEDIIDYNLNKSYGYDLLTKSALYQFWYYMIKDLPHKEKVSENEVHESKLSADDERIKDALTFIQNNYSENISLEEIADSIHISKSECCRLFKRTIEISPFEYLMRYRILQACDIMIKSQRNDESISELAVNVGFNSSSYFNKLFKKYVGCTPKEFRKNSKTERRDKLSTFGMSFSHF